MFHRAQHAADLGAQAQKYVALRSVEVSAVSGCFDPVLGFLLLGVGVAQLTYEMSLVVPLGPRFGNLRTDGTRRTSDLIRKRVPFLRRKTLRHFEDLERKFSLTLVNDQISKPFRKWQRTLLTHGFRMQPN